MSKSLIIGNFVNIESPMHRLDPRMKITLTLLFMVGIFFVKDIWGFLAFAALIFSAIKLANLKISRVFLSLKPLLYILIFTFVVDIFFVRTGEPLFTIFGFSFMSGGIETAGFMAARMCLLFMGASLLTLCTSNVALTDAMESMLKPFRFLGLHPHEIAMVTSIALRFIPILLDETYKIRDAQSARGASFEYGSAGKRIKAYVSLFVPLFVSAFRHAEELACAMEARCYRGGEGRTRFKEYHFGKNDFVALAITCVLILLVVVWYFI